MDMSEDVRVAKSPDDYDVNPDGGNGFNLEYQLFRCDSEESKALILKRQKHKNDEVS